MDSAGACSGVLLSVRHPTRVQFLVKPYLMYVQYGIKVDVLLRVSVLF